MTTESRLRDAVQAVVDAHDQRRTFDMNELRAALSAPSPELDVERWKRAQERVIATTSYDANHVYVLSDAVAREYVKETS